MSEHILVSDLCVLLHPSQEACALFRRAFIFVEHAEVSARSVYPVEALLEDQEDEKGEAGDYDDWYEGREQR